MVFHAVNTCKILNKKVWDIMNISELIKELLKRASALFLVLGVALLLLVANGRLPISGANPFNAVWSMILSIVGSILAVAGIVMAVIDWRTSIVKLVDQSSMVSSPLTGSNEKAAIPKTYLFGYFFVEQDGLEKKILKFNSPENNCLMSGETVGNSVEDAVDAIILKTVAKHGITPSELLKAGLSRPVYHHLFKKKPEDGTIQPTPYIFFKIGLHKEISGTDCEWRDKKIFTPSWNDENLAFHLQAPEAQEIGKIFKKDFISSQFGFSILECIDVLIFRKNAEQQIEFLLIHRYREDENVWEYPKGGMRYHETYLEAVHREVQEETSILPEEMEFCSYLGWQTVDVSKRRKPYNTLRVHGVTMHYTSNSNKTLATTVEGHDKSKWVPLEQAKREVWMKEDSYAAEFFRRWKSNEEEILRKAGIR